MFRYIKVRVFTGSTVLNVERRSSDAYYIYVKEKPENGMANHAVLSILAEELHVEPHRLKIVKGSHHSRKIISLLEEPKPTEGIAPNV